jgi:hypothetical protein
MPSPKLPPFALAFRHEHELSARPGAREWIEVAPAGELVIRSGRVAATDAFGGDPAESLACELPAGRYPVDVSVHWREQPGGGPRGEAAFARLRVAAAEPARWEPWTGEAPAKKPGGRPRAIRRFTVESGAAAFADAARLPALGSERGAGPTAGAHAESAFDGELVAFRPGADGSYAGWRGIAADGRLACLALQFSELEVRQWRDVIVDVLGFTARGELLDPAQKRRTIPDPALAEAGLALERMEVWASRPIDFRRSLTLQLSPLAEETNLTEAELAWIRAADGETLARPAAEAQFLAGGRRCRLARFDRAEGFGPDERLRISFQNGYAPARVS